MSPESQPATAVPRMQLVENNLNKYCLVQYRSIATRLPTPQYLVVDTGDPGDGHVIEPTARGLLAFKAVKAIGLHACNREHAHRIDIE